MLDWFWSSPPSSPPQPLNQSINQIGRPHTCHFSPKRFSPHRVFSTQSFLHTDFSPHRFRTKTAKISIKLHKLFKFFTEIWNFSTWQIFLHGYNLWYLWQIWGLLGPTSTHMFWLRCLTTSPLWLPRQAMEGTVSPYKPTGPICRFYFQIFRHGDLTKGNQMNQYFDI